MKALLLIASLLPLSAGAGEFTDLLMAPGLFAHAPDGPVLAYVLDREVPEGGPVPAIDDGRLRVAAAAGTHGRQLVVSREDDGKVTPIAEFPASGPNPALLYFLESTARAMAETTGGSPFYIRNRMREALAAADLGAATTPRQVVVRPFTGDPNRAKMGDFADLGLTFRFDPAAPARILELSADTAAARGGYHDRLVLIAED
jgi:hypothetical protein